MAGIDAVRPKSDTKAEAFLYLVGIGRVVKTNKEGRRDDPLRPLTKNAV